MYDKEKEQKRYRNWLLRNTEKRREYKKNWYLQNRDKKIEDSRIWRAKNREKHREYTRNWRRLRAEREGRKFLPNLSYNINWRPFEEARKFARSLGVGYRKEWEEYCKSGNKPRDIPSSCNYVYEDKWISWSDFLGYKSKYQQHHEYILPYSEAKELLRSLKISGQEEFRKLAREGKLPKGIPHRPDYYYSRKRS